MKKPSKRQLAALATVYASAQILFWQSNVTAGTKSSEKRQEPVEKSEVSKVNVQSPQTSKSGIVNEPIRITPRFPQGLYFDCLEPYVGSISGKLISINGTSLLGKSDFEIYKLLHSNPENAKTIVYLDSNDVLKSFQVILPSRKIEPITDPISFANSLREQMGLNFNSSNSWTRPGEALDLYARASSDAAYRAALQLPKMDNDVLGKCAANVLTVFDKFGAFSKTKTYLNVTVKNVKELHSFGDFSRTLECALLKDLLLTGRFEECQTITKRMIASTIPDKNDFRKKQTIDDLNWLLAQTLEAQGKNEEALKVVRAQTQVTGDSFDSLITSANLAEMLERLGDYHSASEIWARKFKFLSNNQSMDNRQPLDGVRERCYYLLKMAELFKKSKQIASAEQTLQDAVALYEKSTFDEDRANAEKLVDFFPKPSDLKAELKNLKQGKLQESNLMRAGEFEGLQGSVKASLMKQEEQYALLVKIANTKDFDQIEKNAKILLNELEHQLPDDNYPNREVDLFCGLLQQARELSDKGDFKQSDFILSRLKSYANNNLMGERTIGFVELETAINHDRQKKPGSCWSIALAKLWSKDRPDLPLEQHKSRIFQALSTIYRFAGESKRARLMMNHALTEQINEDSRLAKDEEAAGNIKRDKVLLLLDDASLCADECNLTVSKTRLSEALALCAVASPAKGNESNQFNQIFRSKVAGIVQTWKSKGLSNTDLERSLQDAINITGKGALVEDPSIGDYSRNYYADYATIPCYLAKLKLDDGDIESAFRYSQEALKQCGNVPNYTVLVTSAEIANAHKEYAQAASLYFKSTNTGIINSDPYARQVAQNYALASAVSCAEKATNYDPTELAAIYLNYGTTLESVDNLDSAEKYFRKALVLIPEAEPGHKRLVQRISNLEMRRTALENQKKAKAGNTANTATNNLPMSPQELKQFYKAQALGQLKQVTANTMEADKSENNNRFQEWLNLANLELQAELPDQAFAHATIALERYDDRNNYAGFKTPLLMAASANSLASLGHYTQGESLLKQALRKSEALFGFNSASYYAQLAQLASFYFDQEKTDIGFSTLDRLCDVSPRILEVSSFEGPAESACQTLTRCASRLASKGKGDIAEKILQKMLTNQQKFLDKDDQRIGDLLLALADTAITQKNYDQAEELIIRAAKIHILYVGKYNLHSATGGRYDQLCLAIGRKDRQSIDVRGIGWVSPALLEKLGYVREAKIVKETHRLPSGEMTDEDRWKLSLKEERSRSENLQRAQELHRELCKDQPYGRAAVQMLSRLMYLALIQKNWQVLKESATERCRIYERQPDIQAGRSYGCVIPSERRMDYYVNAAKAEISLGHPEKAKVWAERAASILPQLNCQEYVQIAEIAFDCGDKALAINYLMSGEKCFTEQYQAVFPVRASFLWERLGNPQKAQELRASVEKMRKERDAQTQKMQNSPFARTGI
ncbi:MAG: hypothetical protein IPP97_16500 [Candidatus Obscuribacter sp.]|nr:hypothetical protein [Candidatus Obscuribacter sp.]